MTAAGRQYVKIVRDPIHGYLEFPSDLFETLIDTPLFQRLRDIRQLGLSHLVYPGAVHTRFEHSLGAAHVMNRLIDSIVSNTRMHVIRSLSSSGDENLARVGGYIEEVLRGLERIRREAVVAALLHDIGHLMLSHVMEAAVGDYVHR